jgi:hypothetical protein
MSSFDSLAYQRDDAPTGCKGTAPAAAIAGIFLIETMEPAWDLRAEQFLRGRRLRDPRAV